MTSPAQVRPPRGRRTLGQIQAAPHAPRDRHPDTIDPDAVLAALPLGDRDWKRILAALLAKHGHKHGIKLKGVSNRTLYERPRFLFQFFKDLHAHTIYHTVEPRCLGNRHVAGMVHMWAERGLAAGTIANYLSILRVFATWIGKDPGIVRTAAQYLGADSPLAHRRQVADHDHSWVAAGVELPNILERIRALCPYVAIQAEFSREFGLRPKEARCLRPHEAVIARAQVIARDVDPKSLATHYLHLGPGTKGGRPRDVPIETQSQWELIRQAQALVPAGRYLGRPGHSLKQNTGHYYRVLAKVGVARNELGVTPHGLRHEFANTEYEKHAGAASPVRRGLARDRETERAAREVVSRLLGHTRRRAASFYCGSPQVASMAALADDVPEPDDSE
jgi:integrase